jgi:hypothetical protein
LSFLTFCQWLADTPGSIALHESVYVYPVIESIHVLTLCLFLGLAVTLDLRLLGIGMRQTPVSEVADRLLPWTVAGFVSWSSAERCCFTASRSGPIRTFSFE